jgi:hypothetical protein
MRSNRLALIVGLGILAINLYLLSVYISTQAKLTFEFILTLVNP